jgi:hypothetical protein
MTSGINRRRFMQMSLVASAGLGGNWVRSAAAANGQTLYNGIVLDKNFPPNRKVTQQCQLPSWLTNPPPVIPIDVGRQLFVDDFLIEKTDLARTQHRPVMFAGNPVFKDSLPFSGGVWHDPADKTIKTWYAAGGGYNYATSKDGKSWTKVASKVLQGGDTVWLDLEEKDPSRRFKAFWSHYGDNTIWVFFSPDGIQWTRWPHNGVTLSDRTTVFYNPFRKVWVNSMRRKADFPATSLRQAYDGRGRFYAESRDLMTWDRKNPFDTYWTGPDEKTRPTPARTANRPSSTTWMLSPTRA